TKPVPSITVKPADPSNDTTPTFNFSATDNHSAAANIKLECKLDAGVYALCTSPKTPAALAEGSHGLTVQATDEAGNSDTAAYTWVLDVTKPTATITGHPSDPTNATSASFSFTAADPTSGGVSSGVNKSECSLDGAAYATCTSPQVYSGLAEGS